jgi:AraC-like DNA-binding protein
MSEEFITQKPQNSRLEKYISYYYFHSSQDTTHSKKFIYYPNYKNALTIYKNAAVAFTENHSKSSPDNTTHFSFIYSGVQKQFRTAEMVAPFDKIGVVFQELGINHFISVPLSSILCDPVQKSFDYFGTDFIHLCEQVYNEREIENKVALLDTFFLNNLCDFQEVMLKKCVHLILNSKQKLTVQKLSEECSTNRKTLLRIFKKHLCCTTKEYIDIVQFRKALNDYLLLHNKSSLTEIALTHEYYDQAQFINHFKKLTGINPKEFFKNIAHLGKEDTFWTFQQ